MRVRSPRQMEELARRFRPFSDILTGFILPKFFIENCGAYIEVIQGAGADYYYMPIFESASMIDLRHRYDRLAEVRDRMEAVSGRILNVRVGGNDFSHAFGLRRQVDQTIYQLRPVASLLTDIVDPDSFQLVSSSAESTRMNEYNTHFRWADRIVRLAQVYGVKDSPA